MSKCVKCGNEILTGDIHWEMGLCNNCYNELYKDHKTHISLDKMWLKLAQDFRDENEKLQDKVADLEAKLAEKEKEISNLNGLVRERDKRIKNLKTNKKRVIEHKNKTKISFAVEQLEKLKVKLHIIHTNGYLKAVDEEIDDQIKELKGKVENE